MQEEKKKGLFTKGADKKEGDFVSIEKKISSRFAKTILLCCIVLGVVTSILSYVSSISAVSETINNTSDVAADYVAAALQQYVAIAYETGSIARLADPEGAVRHSCSMRTASRSLISIRRSSVWRTVLRSGILIRG